MNNGCCTLKPETFVIPYECDEYVHMEHVVISIFDRDMEH